MSSGGAVKNENIFLTKSTLATERSKIYDQMRILKLPCFIAHPCICYMLLYDVIHGFGEGPSTKFSCEIEI